MTISQFSGQGAQYEGMGKDIAEAFPELLYIYDKGSEILGYDLKDVCFNAPLEELSKTIYSQPAIMATSILCLEAAKSKNYGYEGVAGHSLGEYAAMYAAGMITIDDAFQLIKARAEAMNEAAQNTTGSMAAVAKIPPEQVEDVCCNAKEFVIPVNYNSPMQTVIAGTPEGIAEVTDTFKDMKARVLPLKVAGAFHSKLMQPAADKFYETARKIKFLDPQVRFYSNVTGGELTDFSDMPSLLAKHIVSPVRFVSEIMTMHEDGADRFVEFGPGKTLTGLIKKTLNDVKALNIENLKTLEGAAIYE